MSNLLIVGLGNPGDKYEGTYHNMGFDCVDILADKLGIKFDKKELGAIYAIKYHKDGNIILAKPQTFMNLSGDAVKALKAKFKVELRDIIIVYDDYDINIGYIRFREKGSAGSHNGMKDITMKLASKEFFRMRIGIKDDQNIPILNLVLSRVDKQRRERIDVALSKAADVLYNYSQDRNIIKLQQEGNVKC